MEVPSLLAVGATLLLLVLFEGRDRLEAHGFDVRFGIFETDTGGSVELRETSVIPLLTMSTGFSFGYMIQPPDNERYATHEVLHLPAPPVHIDFPVHIEKQDGGRVLRTPQIVRQGLMIYPYGFSRGDPMGTWRLDVYVNDRLERVFRFQVVPPF